MKKTKNLKLIFKNIAIIIILLNSILTFSQISYNSDKEIILPDIPSGGSAPVDIIYANGKTYVYTSKSILVYENGVSSFVGEIHFTGIQKGRFALQYQNPSYYAPDIRLMAYDDENEYLYVVTPNLTIAKVSTATFTSSLTPVINTPPVVNIGHNSLHGPNKLVYDSEHDRLFWFFRVKESNMHSWGSYFGVYDKHNGMAKLYSEYKVGDDESGDYHELLSTFTYNPNNNDFYLSRRKNIEFWNIDMQAIPPAEKVSKYHNIQMTQMDNGKMIVISKNGSDYLITFPYRVFYDLPMTKTHNIYQVNLDDPTLISNLHEEIAPNKMIADAIYMNNDDLMVCYANNPEEHQVNITNNHDVSVLKYISGWFRFQEDSFYTNVGGETDNNVMQNLNRPFKLLKGINNSIYVSKKNDIAEISFDGSTYTVSNKYYARDNFFGKGIIYNNEPLVLNSLYGIDYFNYLGHVQKKTSHPVFNTEYNPIGRKMYLFNRLTADNTGFYIYDLNGEQLDGYVSVGKPIGDLKFNSLQNHILVSLFKEDESNGAEVLVFDGITGLPLETENISISGYDYPSRMFVSPNGKLFVSLNMKYDDSSPVIKVLNASDYSPDKQLGTVNSGLTTIPEDKPSFYVYQSHFDYNSLNDKVYGTIAYSYSNYKFMPPYQNSYNSPNFAPHDPTEGSSLASAPRPYGKFYSFDGDDNPLYYSDIQMPSEIVCADKVDVGNEDYEGTVFINCNTNTENEKLYLFDCKNNQVTFEKSFNHSLYDIEYSPLTNSVYVYEHEFVNLPNPFSNENIIHIHKLSVDGNINEIWQEHGFASSISFNPYDEQLYVYYRANEKLMGQHVSKVYTLDPFSNDLYNTETDDVDLPYKNLTPSIVPMANHPHFDAYNKSYFPNGGHSSVSVVEFTAKEALNLHFNEFDKSDWVSIPRNANNQSPNWEEEFESAEIIFDKDRFENHYQTLFNLKHENAGDGGVEEHNTWVYPDDWVHYPNENNFSVHGYKMTMDNLNDNILYMYGNIKSPATTFPVYKDVKNWIGYFPVGEQDVFDALEDHIEDIEEIWHQEYYCYRPHGGGIIFGPEGGGHSIDQWEGPEWACSRSVHRVKYGDMLIINPSKAFDGSSEENPMFYWSNGGFTPRSEPRPEPTYFTYTETDTYKPFIIELDSTVNPVEIGAFVGDTCVGACSVIPADTAVILLAYINPGQEDSVSFEQHYSTKSTANVSIRSYMVLNEERGVFEKRSIKTTEGVERAFISFKRKTEEVIGNTDASFSIWPNPAGSTINFSFFAEKEGYYRLRLFDVSGRLVSVIKENEHKIGIVIGAAALKGNGNKLTAGIYFVQISSANYTETKKLVIR